jgi:hypothetical protein
MGNKFSAAVAEQKEAKKRPSVIFHKKKHEQKAVTASNLSSSYHSDLNSKETTSGKSSATSSHTQPFEATTTSTIETPTLGKTPGEDDRMNAVSFVYSSPYFNSIKVIECSIFILTLRINSSLKLYLEGKRIKKRLMLVLL